MTKTSLSPQLPRGLSACHETFGYGHLLWGANGQVVVLLNAEALAFAMQVPEVRELVDVAREILRDATVDHDGYAALERGMDERLQAVLARVRGKEER